MRELRYLNEKSKVQNTKEDNEKLKKRPIVENSIGSIKIFNRIHVRFDKLMTSCMGFVYLGCIKKAK